MKYPDYLARLGNQLTWFFKQIMLQKLHMTNCSSLVYHSMAPAKLYCRHWHDFSHVIIFVCFYREYNQGSVTPVECLHDDQSCKWRLHCNTWLQSESSYKKRRFHCSLPSTHPPGPWSLPQPPGKPSNVNNQLVMCIFLCHIGHRWYDITNQ